VSHARASGEPTSIDRIVPLLARGSAALLWSFLESSVPPGRRTDSACLQLAARALALVADRTYGDRQLAELYETVAAGLMVLEQRSDGIITPSEIIVLARA